jgi:hypothetical protein
MCALLTFIVKLSAVLDHTCLTVTRRLRSLIERHCTIATGGTKVAIRIHVAASDPVHIHLLHTSSEHIHLVVGRRAIDTIRRNISVWRVIPVEAIHHIHVGGSGDRNRWLLSRGGDTRAKGSSTCLESRLERLVLVSWVPGGCRVALSRELSAVSASGCDARRDAAHAGIVVVEMLLSVIVGISTLDRGAGHVLNRRPVAGGKWALHLGRSRHGVATWSHSARAGGFGRVL